MRTHVSLHVALVFLLARTAVAAGTGGGGAAPGGSGGWRTAGAPPPEVLLAGTAPVMCSSPGAASHEADSSLSSERESVSDPDTQETETIDLDPAFKPSLPAVSGDVASCSGFSIDGVLAAISGTTNEHG